MNLLDYILYLIFGGREPPPSPPITEHEIDETLEIASDLEFEEEDWGEWSKRTEPLESVGQNTDEIEIEKNIPYWRRFLGLE